MALLNFLRERTLASGIALALILVVVACEDEAPTQPPARTPRSVVVVYDGSGDYPTIQAAIDRVVDGDTILLANGRFQGDGNTNLDFGGRRIVVRSERNDPAFCVIDCEGPANVFRRGFLFLSGETPQSIVESITIEDGLGEGGGGGIMCIKGSDPTLRNIVFKANRNRALSCGNSSPRLENCVFQSNAGAVYVSNGANVFMSSCSFIDNGSSSAGAAILIQDATVELLSCTFSFNSSLNNGGAISCASTESGGSSVRASNCQFDVNASALGGGAINVHNGVLLLSECVFSANLAEGSGGALRLSNATTTVGRSTFYQNVSSAGSAIFTRSSSSEITQSILAFGLGSAAVICDSLFEENTISLECSDVFGNADGDYVGCLASYGVINDNISADPLFCAPGELDLFLMPSSPCLPPNTPCPMGIEGTCGRQPCGH